MPFCREIIPAILLVVVGLLCLIPEVVAEEAGFTVTAGQRQLFIDDLGVKQIDNLQRTMHHPVKKGAVIRSRPGVHSIQSRSAPAWDPESKIYKFWALDVVNPYWESEDGLHWLPRKVEKAIGYAVYDPHETDPARRFKAAMPPHGFAVSPDGMKWTDIDVPGIPSADEANFSYSPSKRLFIVTAKRGGKYGRAVAIATSTDFKTWDDLGVVFQTDDKDQELGRKHIEACYADPRRHHPYLNIPACYNVDVYNMGVFEYEGIYIGLPSMYHETGKVGPDWEGFAGTELNKEAREYIATHGDYTGFHHLQLTASRDLRHWERLADRRPFMDLSVLGGGAHDENTMMPPSDAVRRGDELWFYYTGARYYEMPKVVEADVVAICLAVLRRDGFISLDATETEGTILTRSFSMPTTKLLVNVSCRKGGWLRAEVLDSSGQVVARSDPIQTDQRSGLISWDDGKLASQIGKSTRVRFTLSNASFYSYWFEE